MMQTVRFIFLGIMLLILGQGKMYAQDPTFTQYFSAPMYLNPALTGFEGGTSIHLNHRDQWFWVGENASKFYTEAFGADVELGCINSAIGITYMHNMEGEGRYRWQNAGLSFARRFSSGNRAASNGANWEFSLGLRVTYNVRGLNWNQFIFSDQLDRVHGFTGQATGLELPRDMMSENRFLDFDFGTYLYRQINKSHSFLAGFSVNHLAQINNSILGINDTLPLRGTFHLAHEFKFYGENSVNPTVKFELQRAASAASIGEFFSSGFLYRSMVVGSGFDFQNKNSVWGGVWFQGVWFPQPTPSSHSTNGTNQRYFSNTTSLILMVGGELGDYIRMSRRNVANRYRIGLSYDLPLSGIRSDAAGTWEVSLAINFSRLSLFDCKCWIPPFTRPKFR